jgi:hypothetical protein
MFTFGINEKGNGIKFFASLKLFFLHSKKVFKWQQGQQGLYMQQGSIDSEAE